MAAITRQHHRFRADQNASWFCGFGCNAMREKEHSNANRYHPIHRAARRINDQEPRRFADRTVPRTRAEREELRKRE